MNNGYYGKPRHPMPVQQFPTFIKVWEAEVIKMQERTKALEALHRPYEIVTGVLTKLSWPNESTVSLVIGGLYVRIRVHHNDRKELFDRMLQLICEELVSWKLRDVEDIPNWTTYAYDWEATLRVTKPEKCKIKFSLDVPIKGTRWIKVTETSGPVERITGITSEWLEEPQDIPQEIGQ